MVRLMTLARKQLISVDDTLYYHEKSKKNRSQVALLTIKKSGVSAT